MSGNNTTGSEKHTPIGNVLISETPDAPHGGNVIGIHAETEDRIRNALGNDYHRVFENFKDATAYEHELTKSKWKAVKLYRRAILHIFVLCLSLFMEGYEMSILGGFFAFPMFRRYFGNTDNGEISSSWQTGLHMGQLFGQMIGLALAGKFSKWFGYRKSMGIFMFAITGTIFLQFLAQNISMLFVGEFLCGIPYGTFQILPVSYATSFMPLSIRPYVNSYVNLCWIIGQLISCGVLRGFVDRMDNWGWRIPYAIQWIYPVIIIVNVFLMPESPAWLVQNGEIEKARRALIKLTHLVGTDFDISKHIDLLIFTNEQERASNTGRNYMDCFHGINTRRTFITCLVWAAQQWCGAAFAKNLPYFLKQQRYTNGEDIFTPGRIYTFGIIQNVMGIVGVAFAWTIMAYTPVGRRTQYLCGVFAMSCVLAVIGGIGFATPSYATGLASAALMIFFVFLFDMTVGSICYTLITEIPASRLKIHTMAIARISFLVFSVIAQVLNPQILNPGAWNLQGRGALIWAGISFSYLIVAYFHIPEVKDRTESEMDSLFDDRTPAREFGKKKTVIKDTALDNGVFVQDENKSETSVQQREHRS
ncbi:hypothetical protein B0O99DRAFT_685675 [Bisporella sp. PMI_857]|nr:hypothetical protein B0O99DRAFT_685675 [Bisporella sp. PMI_857]